MINPSKVFPPAKDVWAGSFNTVAKAGGEKVLEQMMLMGLSYHPRLVLLAAKALSFMPQRSKKMIRLAWNCVAIGQHHVMELEQSGQVRNISNLMPAVTACDSLYDSWSSSWSSPDR